MTRDREQRSFKLDLAFALITAAFFYFVFDGWTIGSAAQQMASYFPWRGTSFDLSGAKTGYPQSDFADSFWPHWKFLADQLRSLHLPLWYPYDFGGTRAPESGLFGLYYPVRMALLFVFGAMNGHTAMMMLHSFLAMAFMHRFLVWLKCSTPAAILGALLWAFNGHNIYYVSLEFPLVLAAWLPLALWAAGRAIEERSWRWAVASGAASGLTLFCGYANYIYAFGLITAAWWLYLVLTMRRRPMAGRSILVLVACAGATALCVGAAFWLPFIDVFQTTVRAPASMASQIGEAITPLQFLRGLVWPKSLAGPVWGFDSPSMAFIGIPALVAIVFVRFRAACSSIFFSVIGVLAIAMITGFRPLFEAGRVLVPMFGAIHPSTIGSDVLMLCLAVLAPMGLDSITARLRGNRANTGAAVGVSVGAIGLTAISLFVLLRVSQPLQPTAPRLSFPDTPLTEKLRALQLEAHQRMVPAQIKSAVWSPPIFFAGSHASVDISSVFGYDSLVQPENFWVAQAVASAGQLPENLVNPSEAARGDVATDRLPVRLLRNLSIGLVASPPQVPIHALDQDAGQGTPSSSKFVQLYCGEDGTIWQIGNAPARAFLAPQAELHASAEDALRALVRPDYDPQKRVAIVPANRAQGALVRDLRPPPDGQRPGSVDFVVDAVNGISLKVSASQPSLLVLNDTWAPGWRVTINGVSTPVMHANYAYRAVYVPQGQSIVEFHYRPLPLIVGLCVTFCSIAALVLLVFWSGLRGANKAHSETRRPQ
jgi:hypothetical protein